MERGIGAISTLATEARVRGADKIIAVATSAVRDASNGQEFHDRARTDAGIELRILGGLEEAELIGLGITTDPALLDLRDFRMFDLGGGSLECLSFKDRNVTFATSLPLGCVRLTEMFLETPSAPLASADARKIASHVKASLLAAGVPLPVPRGTRVIGTGGTLTTLRAMSAAKRDIPLGQAEGELTVPLIRQTLKDVGSVGLDARKLVPGLSPQRADVFPTALATLLALAELGEFEAFRHSFRNLRWGVAAELLSSS